MKELARVFRIWQSRLPQIAMCAFVLLVWLCPVTTSVGQTDKPSTSGMSRPSLGDASNGLGPINPANPAKLEHMREDERRKRLLSDTAKLVELSNDLRAQVEKSSKDELSLDVVRKAAELEKLARDVKERMKN